MILNKLAMILIETIRRELQLGFFYDPNENQAKFKLFGDFFRTIDKKNSTSCLNKHLTNVCHKVNSDNIKP